MNDNVNIPYGSHKERVLLALLISGIIFVVCPMFIVSNNLAEIDLFKLKESAIVSGILFVACGVVLFLIAQIKNALPILLGLLIFVSLTAFLLPLSTSASMTDPQNQQINVTNFIISGLVAVGGAIGGAKIELVKKLALTFVLVMTLVTSVTSYLAINDQLNRNQATFKESAFGEFSTLSANRNIIMMSFDGVPHNIMTSIFKESPDLASKFQDFTYFPNTFSQGPATNIAELGVVYGIQDYKKMADTEADLRDMIVDTELYKQTYLNKVDDVVNIHKFAPGRKPLKISIKEKHPKLFLVNNSFSRIFTRFFFKTGVPSLIKKTLGNVNSETVKRDPSKHNGAHWDFKNLQDMDRYDEFVDSLSVSQDSDLTVRYYHTVFTHFPVDLDRECNYRSADIEWYNENQNSDGIKNQTFCVIKKMEDVITKLKTLGIYDNSLVVLKSDHGEPADYFDKYPDNVTFNNHPLHGYNRYRPFMMIKDFGKRQDSMLYDDRKVLLNDLAKTLCIASEVNTDCDIHGGLNLLSEDRNLSEPYYVYIVKNRKSSWRYASLMSVKVPNRQVDLLEFLKEHPDVKVRK